ncbi:MAG TPA: hypothetical protein VND87_14550 [Stellaceae bacterium]|nr:hypothetical protein [Stellaceae bacterium]
MIGEMQDPKIAAPHRCLDRYARDRQIGRFLYRESISGPRPVGPCLIDPNLDANLIALKPDDIAVLPAL